MTQKQDLTKLFDLSGDAANLDEFPDFKIMIAEGGADPGDAISLFENTEDAARALAKARKKYKAVPVAVWVMRRVPLDLPFPGA